MPCRAHRTTPSGPPASKIRHLPLPIRALVAALLLGLGGCASSQAPEPPPPGCVPAGCAGKPCGHVDCGTTCQAGSGCVAAGPVTVDGGLTEGGAICAGPAHQVQGTVSLGSAPQVLRSSNFRIEQGTLR